MKNRFRCALAALTLVTSLSASAHEFWMLPQSFTPAAGASVGFTLTVGQDFVGEQIPFYAALVAGLRRYSMGGVQDLGNRIPATTVLPELVIPMTRAGTHLIAFDSHPSKITMTPDKFHAYLHDEGLDAIVKQREAAGTAGTPGRERFRRNVKTLLHVGGKSDATYAVRTGQRLEIVPLTDPLAKAAGGTVNFNVFFDDKPIAGTLVKAWHKQDGQTLIIKKFSAADGKVAFTLPYAGLWMISVVHMIPAVDTQEADWDSYWGNLTFELPANRALKSTLK
jgi:hypothetical protein